MSIENGAPLILPQDWKFPECNHPIEKWCSNCDYDCETWERIPHFRKYKEIYMWTDKEFEREMKKYYGSKKR